ncbi:NYN domain-containing protein [Methylacidimicrobium sp. B4]|uniref:NYN domain-containing protein n=1 Tax=Methylacidimicrobium sp. B4 TaxID=2796139 RepID=UPI001A8E2E80|nr:NYN domain-containing protein [Methylacidimicrobium sp. B4]QSR85535.1 NYN domain-containing protein [Methylacidimicrobium sp. B4]
MKTEAAARELPATPVLVVDGHSVVFAWKELRELHARSPNQARHLLTERLRHLHDSGAWSVILVFDGRFGSRPDRIQPASDDMVIAYSSPDCTADSLIEGFVARRKDRQRVTVVTADQAERRTIEALGAWCSSPEWLSSALGEEQGNLVEALGRVHRKARW